MADNKTTLCTEVAQTSVLMAATMREAATLFRNVAAEAQLDIDMINRGIGVTKYPGDWTGHSFAVADDTAVMSNAAGSAALQRAGAIPVYVVNWSEIRDGVSGASGSKNTGTNKANVSGSKIPETNPGKVSGSKGGGIVKRAEEFVEDYAASKGLDKLLPGALKFLKQQLKTGLPGGKSTEEAAVKGAQMASKGKWILPFLTNPVVAPWAITGGLGLAIAHDALAIGEKPWLDYSGFLMGGEYISAPVDWDKIISKKQTSSQHPTPDPNPINITVLINHKVADIDALYVDNRGKQ